MKKLSWLFSVCILLWQALPLYASSSTDTIKSIPFIENWESGSFSTNGWTFPYSQGNWSIGIGTGDSTLNARFSGQPSQTNYINKLTSEWLDATQLTCDYLYLDFDMRFQAVNTIGTEFLKVIILFDSGADTIITFRNDVLNLPWKHYTFGLFNASGRYFRINFLAFGQNTGNITAWSIDNIAVTRKCKPPHSIAIENTGQCGFSSCLVRLSWERPICSGYGQTTYIYDDGTAENGLAFMPGYLGWLGNKFPLTQQDHGFLTSFDMWFWTNPLHGSDKLTLDIFDMNSTLLGSSEPFTPPDSTWITVNVNDIWFQGPFYALVKWNYVTAPTNYLGMDENGGTYTSQLAMSYDGTWPPTLVQNCGGPLAFLQRANATLDNKKKIIPIDTTLLLGYNIYKAEDSGFTDFVKINSSPITDTTFKDTIDCAASYYITSQYNNCESDPGTHLLVSCSVGVPEASNTSKLKIDPNPVSGIVEISSDFLINTIRITDLYGRQQSEIDNINQKNIRIDLSDLPNGIYLLSAKTEVGQAIRKIIVQH